MSNKTKCVFNKDKYLDSNISLCTIFCAIIVIVVSSTEKISILLIHVLYEIPVTSVFSSSFAFLYLVH